MWRSATKQEREDVKTMLSLVKLQTRKVDFKPYVEPFRPLNGAESTAIHRLEFSPWIDYPISEFLISYQAQTGGFTICNIILDNILYSGSSHCSKVDRWLPIRGQMLAFRRALESEGVELISITNTGETVTNG